MKMREILTERYLNLFPSDSRREQYRDEVWDLLQKVYEPIGGIKGSGFESPDDMVEKIPMWKLVRRDGRIVAALLYKDKQGRKAVASATDGTDTGKAELMKLIRAEPPRSYSEQSKAALGFFFKSMPDAQQHLVPFEQAQKISDDPVVSIRDEWPPLDDDEEASTRKTLDRYPFLVDYGYFREFGGSWHFKVMVGTPEKAIDFPPS